MASLPSSSRVLSTFVCHNPQCMSRCKSFANERGYTMHFQRLPACFDFVRQETMQVIPNRKRMYTPANEITVSSSKRASVLRCEMVNDTADVFPATFSGALNDGKNTTREHSSGSPPDHFDFENDDNNMCHMDTSLFTSDQKWTIALLKLLDDMNAPDYAFTGTYCFLAKVYKQG
jgi:hypothetical protein